MQDPNADTEWNDVLRAKGIIPQKEKEVSEDDIINMLEHTIQQKTQGKDLSEMTLDELNDDEDNIDEEEERIFEQYRRQRMAEMKETLNKSRFGDVREISKSDYVTEVNKAGDGIWVILHIYKQGIPLCTLINDFLRQLAQKFPATKFLRSISTVCIPNYPDKNLPTIFVYRDGDMKKQFIGPLQFGGMNLTKDQLEWMLSEVGAVETDLEENPRKQIRDVMSSALRDDDSDDDY